MKNSIKKPNRAGLGSFDSNIKRHPILILDVLKSNSIQSRKALHFAGGVW